MALDDREEFRAGFLCKCAEAGLGPADAVALAEKVAGGWGEAAKDGLIWGATKLPLYGLAGAAVLGAGGGLALAHANKGTVDPDEVKKQELIAAYNTFGEELRQRRRMAPAAPRRGRISVPV